MSNAIEARGNRLPVSLRAKAAIETYLNTGRGLSSLAAFIFPSNNITGLGYYDTAAGWLTTGGDNENYPYRNVNAYNSSIVMACLNWIIRSFAEASPTVYRIVDNGEYKSLPGHRFITFLRRPNPYYSFAKLREALLISYYLDGNAYLFKERGDGGTGQTKGLYYIPHYLIRGVADVGQFISYYEYNVNGRTYQIPPERIVHIRHGLDPYNPLSGRKILDPVLSEVYTDEEAAKFVSALIRNTAIPGVVIMPDTEKVKVDEASVNAIKESYKRKFGGAHRGEPLITNFAAKVFQMGFSPEQLQFKDVRRLPEERVAAQFQIAPVVAGLGAGLDKSTYSNYEQAEKHSYQSALLPVWTEIGEELTYQLLPEFTGGNSKEFVFEFDYSKVQALQESQDVINARHTRLWSLNAITRAELREAVGLTSDPKTDNIYFFETRPTPGLPAPSPVDNPGAKALYLLKAGDADGNLDTALDMSLEATASGAVKEMEGDLDGLFKTLGDTAETEANKGVDRFNPEAESNRLINDIVKSVGLTVLIRAIWGGMGKTVYEETIDTVILRLAVPRTTVADVTAEAESKGVLLSLANQYEGGLVDQTKRAIAEAIKGAESGESVASIARRLKSLVEGREMYPGVYEEGYQKAKDAGATEEQARRAGEAKARRYRAKLIAETETRTFQNTVTVDALGKAGYDRVKVTDGDGCGWVNHDDIDKAHNTIRLLSDARRYPLAHPNCKRKFYPHKGTGK